MKGKPYSCHCHCHCHTSHKSQLFFICRITIDMNKWILFQIIVSLQNESHFQNELVTFSRNRRPFSLTVSRISVELELKLIKCVFIYINIFNNLDFVSKFVFHLRLVAWAFHKIFYNSPLPLHPLFPATFLLAARFAFGDLFNLVYCINLFCFDQHFSDVQEHSTVLIMYSTVLIFQMYRSTVDMTSMQGKIFKNKSCSCKWRNAT